MKIRFERRWDWNRKRAIIWWVATFIAFGPFQLLIHSNQYEGAIIFSNNPPLYFLMFGLSVATMTVAIVYFIDWIVKRRRSHPA